MLESDGKRFRDLIRGMGRMYGQDLDGAVLDTYWIALRDWDYGDFEAAAAHLMGSAKFMPRPAEFNALRKAGEPTAHEAWAIAIENCTSWRTGHSDAGERIDRVVRMVGGYERIAMADQERDLPHIQRRFLEAYEGLVDREDVREAVPQIAYREEGFGRLSGNSGGFERLGAAKDRQLPRVPVTEDPPC